MLSVITFSPSESTGGIGQYTSQLESHLDANITSIRFENEAGLRDYLRLFKSVIAERPDAVHIQYNFILHGPHGLHGYVVWPLLWLITRFTNSTIVISLHEIFQTRWVEDSPIKRTIGAGENWAVALACDHIIALSADVKEMMAKSSPITPIVIPHGSATQTIDMSVEEARSRFGDLSGSVVSMVGFVSSNKRFDDFFKLARAYPEYTFLIAGGARTEADEKLQEEVTKKAPENMKITGYLEGDDFHAAFIASDAIFISYESIRQSGILNWAIAYDRPVLANNLDYFKMVAEDYGAVEIFHTTQEAICMLEDVVNQSSNPGRELFLAENSMDAVSYEYLKLYR